MKPFVTIIVPERNEEKFIARCLESILHQDYGPEYFEVIVVDGISTDKTCEIIQRLQREHKNLHLLDNPRRIVPTALNLGLQRAKGEIIIRVDGHATIAPDYISRCVEMLEETKADCVGGPINSISENQDGRAIALAMSSKFGVGNSRFRVSGGYEGYVDTLAFGAYKKSAFERIGVFDEELVRCQDDEFNYRLLKNGGKIYMTPKVTSCYFPRTNLKKLWRQYYEYGLWKIRVLQKHPSVMQPRQFVPPFFVAMLLLLTAFSAFAFPVRLALAGVSALYGMTALSCALALWLRHENSSFSVLLAAFPILHISYGLGFLCGLFKFRKKWRQSETSAATPRWPRVVITNESIKECIVKPFVSIIVPVRNEEKFITRCLDSIMSQDYGHRFFEVVIVDGVSTDKTREIIQNFQRQYGNLILLSNPQRFIPVALNLALPRAKGEIIIRVDGHATIAPDYISQCVNVLESTRADCVGGAIASTHENENGRAIALAMSSHFGIGNARFRLSGYEGYVDTLAFGAYQRSVFDRIGIFDEEFIGCEDDEFNYRLIKNGGKIYLSPQINSRYFPRADLQRLWQQYFKYGLWKIRVLQRHAAVMQLRQFIPPLFVFTLLFLTLASIFVPFARLLLAGVNSLYAFSALGCAAKLWRRAPNCSFPILLAAFPVLHISYGLGFLCGFIKFRNKWRESTAKAAVPFHPRAEYSVVSLQK